jgi:hypothetical protein
MPATFPSHAAAVLPLKLWKPEWFDGVALVIGAAAPDLPYEVGHHRPPYTYAHTPLGALATVPATMAAAWLVRWAAPEVAAHSPGFVHDYGVLGSVRHPWWVTASSALIGTASHLAWDHVTHQSITGTPIGIPRLGRWALPLHLASSAVGLVAWGAISARIARRRDLVAWHGPAPKVTRRPAAFWGTAAVVGAVGVAVTAMAPIVQQRFAKFLPPVPSPAALSARLLATTAGALIAAKAAASKKR